MSSINPDSMGMTKSISTPSMDYLTPRRYRSQQAAAASASSSSETTTIYAAASAQTRLTPSPTLSVMSVPIEVGSLELLTWEKIKTLAGYFIVFQADNTYFFHAVPYHLKDIRHRIGIISLQQDGSYKMELLRSVHPLRSEDEKADPVAAICLLSKQLLQQHPILARKATVDEVCRVCNAIEQKQAAIDYFIPDASPF